MLGILKLIVTSKVGMEQSGRQLSQCVPIQVVQEVLLIAALRCSVVGRDFPALEVVGLETLGYLDLATIQLLESIVMTGLENIVGAAFL